jgi:addiction module HigA family antidote
MAMKKPVHPGRIVRGAIEELDVSVTDAARALRVARPTLSNLLNGKAGVSPEMAVRLAKAIGSTPGFWLRLQMNYDLARIEQRADAIVVQPLAVPAQPAP